MSMVEKGKKVLEFVSTIDERAEDKLSELGDLLSQPPVIATCFLSTIAFLTAILKVSEYIEDREFRKVQKKFKES